MEIDLNIFETSHYLKEPVEGLVVRIESVKPIESETSPHVKIFYRILTPSHEGLMVGKSYYLTEKAKYRLRNVAIACGLGSKGNDGKVHFEKKVDPIELVGHTIVIDAVLKTYNGKESVDVDKERAYEPPARMAQDDDVSLYALPPLDDSDPLESIPF